MFKTSTRWACFKRLCCCVAAAPLLCCTVAAAGCRLGQRIFWPTELRLQCFVDDPVMAVRDRACQIQVAWNPPFLLDTALGFRFQWRRGDRSPSIAWIGIKFTIGVAPVTVDHQHLPRHKKLDGYFGFSPAQDGLISVAEVQRGAGLFSWITVLVKYIVEHSKPFEHRMTTTSAKSHPCVVRCTGLAGHQLDPYSSCLQTQLPHMCQTNSRNVFPLCRQLGQPRAWMAIEWNKPDRKLLCSNPRRSSLAGRVGVALDTWIVHM